MFTYDSLSCKNSEIRLIRFAEPADAAAPIRLELCHASMTDTHYAALSYAWGDHKRTSQIYVNGGSFTISRSLHDALKQLRQNGVQSWFWVDSICIQQSDPEEKTHQVRQMHAIYTQANLVYIWLGLGSDDSDRAMDFISRIGPRGLAVGSADLWPDYNRNEEVWGYIKAQPSSQLVEANGNAMGSELAQFMFDLLHEKSLHRDTSGRESVVPGIHDLMEREYWCRVWIIQEISLAKEALVLCGTRSVSLDIFDATFTAVSHCICSGLRMLRSDTRYFAWNLSPNFYTITGLTTRRKHRQQDQLRLVDIVYRYDIPPRRPHYSASDPRDIAFALLGIITDRKSLDLHIDYGLSFVEVFTAMTRALIYDGHTHHGSYHLGSCVPRRDNPCHLPSWVPDWREIGKYGVEVFPINYRCFFNAISGMQMPPPIINCESDNKEGLFRCSGCRVDIITEVMQPPMWVQRDEWLASRIVDSDAWLSSILDFAKLGPDQAPGEDYVWRTILFGELGKTRPPNSDPRRFGEEVASLVRKIMRRERIYVESLTQEQINFIRYGPFKLADSRPDLETVDDQLAYFAREWPKSIGACNRERTLFKTVKGMLGLGHVAIETGDIVTLLWGVRSPIILRPRGDGNRGDFTYIGDAYIDGIMYGEFLKTSPPREDFLIY
ncbi:heterokaryon incompatibility protein-domain-containing protein [Mariannaea sp. PMI_226]|nr:heterokaryon incompatibility protein-domain-containing protein [Mariannaea sp. PMI_226]